MEILTLRKSVLINFLPRTRFLNIFDQRYIYSFLAKMKPIIPIILRIIIILPLMKYIYIHIGEIERVNRPFNFQNTSLRPRLQINRPMVKRARIGIYRIQSSLRNEILLHPNPSALVAGEKERIRRKTFVPRLARIDPSFHRSRVFVALIYPLASTVSFFPFSFLPFFLYTYIHAIAWFKLYSPTNRSTH